MVAETLPTSLWWRNLASGATPQHGVLPRTSLPRSLLDGSFSASPQAFGPENFHRPPSDSVPLFWRPCYLERDKLATVGFLIGLGGEHAPCKSYDFTQFSSVGMGWGILWAPVIC